MTPRQAVRYLTRAQTELQKVLDEISKALATGTRPARRLTPKGREAISRAAKKRWREYRRS